MRTLTCIISALLLYTTLLSCKDKQEVNPVSAIPLEKLKLDFDVTLLDSGGVKLTNKSILIGRGIEVAGKVYPITSYVLQWQHVSPINNYTTYYEESKLAWETNGLKSVKLLLILKSDSLRNGPTITVDTTFTINIQNAIYKTQPEQRLEGKIFGKQASLKGRTLYYYFYPSSYGGPFGYSLASFVEDEDRRIRIEIVDKNKSKPNTANEIFDYFSKNKKLKLAPLIGDEGGYSVRLFRNEVAENFFDHNIEVEVAKIEKVLQIQFVEGIEREALEVTFRMKGTLPSGEIDCLMKIKYVFFNNKIGGV